MCCLVVRVYCSLSHHLSQPSPLFLRSLTWDCFICCCFLQLTDDDAMSVTLWLTCLVRVRQHVQLYRAAGIFETPPPPPLSPGPILSHWMVQYMYHVTSWSPNTVQQIQEMKGLRFDWRTLASFQNAPTVGLNISILQEDITTGILIITGWGFFKITFYLTSLYDVDVFFFINYFIFKSASSALF